MAVAGAGGGIGQPLSLLLKQSHYVTKLSLYDIARTVGVAADLSHIDTMSKVKGCVLHIITYTLEYTMSVQIRRSYNTEGCFKRC